MKTFCERLKRVRGSRTLKEIGRLLDANYQTYQRYESGEREPDLEMLHRIGERLGVSVDWLLGFPDAPSVQEYRPIEKTEGETYWKDLCLKQQETISRLTAMLAEGRASDAGHALAGGRTVTKTAS